MNAAATDTVPDADVVVDEEYDSRKIVRSRGAGVFFADVVDYDRAAGTATLINARRLWYWTGAASLSQLAVDGPKTPKTCQFPVSVGRIDVSEIIEVIDVTHVAAARIDSVPIWKA